MENRIDLAIIGGGLFGTSALHFAHKRNLQVKLFEKQSSLGGKIISQDNQIPLELGPNTVQYTAGDFQNLIQEYGLEQHIILGNPNSKRRLILHENRIKALPSSPPSLLMNGVLSFSEKVRFLRTLWSSPKPISSQTLVYDWVRSSFGNTIADYFLDSFIKGIYATDADKLNFSATFPELISALQSNTSVIKGLKAFNAKRPTTIGIATLKGGWQQLPQAIGNRFSADVHSSAELIALNQHDQYWELQFSDGSIQLAKQVLFGNSAPSMLNIQLPFEFPEFQYSNVQLSHFKVEHLNQFPEAYGILFPKREQVEEFGILFNGKIFPTYQKDLITVFSPIDTEIEEMRRYVKARFTYCGKLRHLNSAVWKSGIPKPTTEFLHARNQVTEIQSKFPGLIFGGDYMGNIAVGQRITAANTIIDQYFS